MKSLHYFVGVGLLLVVLSSLKMADSYLQAQQPAKVITPQDQPAKAPDLNLVGKWDAYIGGNFANQVEFKADGTCTNQPGKKYVWADEGLLVFTTDKGARYIMRVLDYGRRSVRLAFFSEKGEQEMTLIRAD